jgi:hypothetical protein
LKTNVSRFEEKSFFSKKKYMVGRYTVYLFFKNISID